VSGRLVLPGGRELFGVGLPAAEACSPL
jgi:hypothetical protein